MLQAQLRQEQRRNPAAVEPAGNEPGDSAQVASQPDRPGISRFGSFMHSRKASALQSGSTVPVAREKELEASLVKEQTLRITAEKKVKEVEGEIEELSASLFQQANEMVATERKENAVLRDKLEALERQGVQHEAAVHEGNAEQENIQLKEKVKVLEHRDTDRRRRLERLEAAYKKIERVKTMSLPR